MIKSALQISKGAAQRGGTEGAVLPVRRSAPEHNPYIWPRSSTAPQRDRFDMESILRREETLEVRLRSTETQFTYYICSRGGRRDWCPLRQIDVHYASLAPQIKLFIKNNQVYLIMQNTSNDIKHRCKLSLCSILIPEYDFCFNSNSN